MLEGYSLSKMRRSPWSYEITNGYNMHVLVELDGEPVIRPGQTRTIKLNFTHHYAQTCHCDVDVLLPTGWTAEYPRTVFFYYNNQKTVDYNTCSLELTVTAPERVDARNDLVIRVISPLNPIPMLIPVSLLG